MSDDSKKRDLKAIMREADPVELLRKLRGEATPAQKRPPAPSSAPAPTFVADETPAPTPSAESGQCDIWGFLVAPVLEQIAELTKHNPLLPVFLVENPYPAYAKEINAALLASDYRVITLDTIEPERMGRFVIALTENRPKGVILFCTSRSALPREYRSLVRKDGYLSIPSPSFERLQQFAKQCRNISLEPQDVEWCKWIGPQELLVASLLSSAHWQEGLRQLALQHSAAQNVGQSRKLSDIYGAESARAWAKQLFNDIDLARKGDINWREVDHGALFAGPPGTGKTTLARAIASESGVTFIPISPVKDWMSGNGLDECIKLMSATFSRARQQKPSIIFIDEIDSIGNREKFTGQNASWNTAFLDALLTEMDGFDGNEGLIVIGATNYPENVDSALRRAGRLDRIIYLTLPDTAALAAMYHGMLSQYPHALTEEDIKDCANNSLGLTGADVEQLVRGARRRARLANNRPISKDDLLDEIYHIPSDAERRPMNPQELGRTAHHEAGHTLVGLKLPTLSERVRIASIIASNETLGFVALAQTEQNATRAELEDRICMALAGRAAEETVYGKADTSTGAGGSNSSNDLALASRIAKAYLGLYGFSDKHPNWYTQTGLEEEAAQLVNNQFERAMKLLRDNRAQFDAIAQALLKEHVLPREALLKLMGGV